MPSRSELLTALARIGQLDDDDIDIAETALLLAALDKPDADLEPYRDHLKSIARKAARATSRSASVGIQAAALTALLVDTMGYGGDNETYDDMDNANLLRVIDRRRGLPVALGVLYLHAGRAYGADLVGLNFPSHFLIRLAARGQRTILDPFHNGKAMGAEDLRLRLKELRGPESEIEPVHYAPITSRDVLLRLQNNIKLRAVSGGDLDRAVDVLESMRVIAPDRSELWWETAVLQSRLGNLNSAINTLEGYLADRATTPGQGEIEDLLRRLRNRVN